MRGLGRASTVKAEATGERSCVSAKRSALCWRRCPGRVPKGGRVPWKGVMRLTDLEDALRRART